MTQLPLEVDPLKIVKHTHSRIRITLPAENTRESKDVSHLYTPLQTLHNLLDVFSFKDFEIKYSHDSDAHTEYIKLTGNSPNGAEAEIHIFSCHCDGDSDGNPPF